VGEGGHNRHRTGFTDIAGRGRVARIVEQDIHIEPGKPLTYRVKVELSFKYEGGN
jgi:flavin-binding protein dodecin